MKKTVIAVTLLLAFCISAAAQQQPQITTESRYYTIVHPFSEAEGKYLGTKLDSFLSFFNEYFHFDVDSLESKLNIKIFPDQSGYSAYIMELTDSSSSFVYIQYHDLARSELVGYVNPDEDFNETLIHYAFIQYLRAFVKNPPLWLEKGFAVYFEKCKFRENREEIYYKENLTWLNSLKKIMRIDVVGDSDDEIIPISKLLFMREADVADNINLFYSQSWGMISFLLNYPDALYNRIIWDSIRSLRPEAGRMENENATKAIFDWVNINRFSKDFYNYVNTLFTFPELVEKGIELYNNSNHEDAKRKFIKAISLEDENFIPYYYLGLVNYHLKDYAMAEFYYNSAIQLDGDKALCYYALGVNAFAENNLTKASDYLTQAGEIDTFYRQKAAGIMAMIEARLPSPTGSTQPAPSGIKEEENNQPESIQSEVIEVEEVQSDEESAPSSPASETSTEEPLPPEATAATEEPLDVQ